ncbi:hypothetical protein PV04_03006 [Phialophora macrospora]|uniref:SnoaL-like domain-containing protein n=1 Tax=Phialophora macrospora TaxID=1851006 RepID=A0A0D2FW98_9EURO|nr:hypothetical protein PV04_03006 [Phialophora macrospora]
MRVKPEVAEAIRRRKGQYCRYLDTKQWDKFETLGLPDSTFAFFNPDGSPMTVGKTALTFPSPKAFTTNLKKTFASVRTLHLVGVGDLDQISEEEVYAIWSMQDQIIMKNSLGLFWMRGGGYYHETWLQKDGEWYLKSLRLERTFSRKSVLASVLLFVQNILG